MAAGDTGPRTAVAMFAADRASRDLGMELLEAGDGRATVQMTVARSMINGHGIAHGGYVSCWQTAQLRARATAGEW